MIKVWLKKTFMLFSMMGLITSCVGVIESTKNAATKSSPAVSSAKFSGIVDGIGIGQSKLQVRFKPATGGSGKYSYHAFVNDLPQPAKSLLGSEITIDSDGYIRMTIDKLAFNTTYYVSVKVRDITEGKYDANTKYLELTTLNYYVPDFEGVFSVFPSGGIAGMTSILVKWNSALVPTIVNGDPFSMEHNVSGYNVYYANSANKIFELLALTDQHTFSFSNNSEFGVLSVTSDFSEKTVTGLSVGTQYYFAVRARQNSTPPKYELNSIVKTTQTFSDVPVTFGGISSATVPNGVQGFSQINVTWPVATGALKYNFYVKPIDVDNGVIHPFYDSSYLVGLETNILTTSKTLSHSTLIQAAKDYVVYIIACKDDNCGWDGVNLNLDEIAGQNIKKTVNTIPAIAPFSEVIPDNILTLEQPDGVAGLTSLELSWSPLDLTKGYYSEIRIYQVLNKTLPISDLNSANLKLLERDLLSVPPYIDPTKTPNLTVANELVSANIGGLTMNTEYCFIALPVLSGNGINVGDEVTLTVAKYPTVKCATPQYKAPVFGTSSLAPVCNVSSTGGSATISWTLPEETNIMSDFEVWYTTNATFEFEGDDGAWENGAGDYVLDTISGFVNASQTSTVIAGLSPSTEYTFGVNAYYRPSGLDPIRSYPSIPMATVTCQTPVPEMVHGSWSRIISIGPRSDRDGVIYPEKLSDDYRQVYYDPAGATHGIVRLGWNDFTVYGTNPEVKVHDYYSSSSEGMGYYVYRMKVQSAADLVDAQNTDHAKWDVANGNVELLKFVAASSIVTGQNWWEASTDAAATELISLDHFWQNGTLISYEIVDYPETYGVTYLYKVVPVFNFIPTKFHDASAKTNIARVIVPHKNEALVHRWMANLDICNRMGRGFGSGCTDSDPDKCVDLENNYRCKFNGFGSVDQHGVSYGSTVPLPEATRYHDFETDLIFDRFELGGKITKANCNGGADCIGAGSPIGLGFTVDDDTMHTIYYDKTNGLFYVWRRDGVAWENLDSFNATSSDVFKLNIFDPTSSNVGPDVYTNAAMEIPIAGIDPREIQAICESVTALPLFPGDTTHNKTMKRRKWDMVAKQHPEMLEANVNLAATYESSYDFVASSQKDYGCNTMGFGLDPNFIANSFDNSNSYLRLKTGSMGRYSTELCTSKYGLQDAIGNQYESYSDLFWGDSVITSGFMQAVVSNVDPENDDLVGINFDGVVAHTAIAASDAGSYFNHILGIPLICSSGCDPDELTIPDLNATNARRDYRRSIGTGAPNIYGVLRDDSYNLWATPTYYGYYSFYQGNSGLTTTGGGRCVYKVVNE